jgi:predicted small lipoprotein YifL
MKKLLVVALVAALVFSIAACAPAATTETPSAPAESSSAEP